MVAQPFPAVPDLVTQPGRLHLLEARQQEEVATHLQGRYASAKDLAGELLRRDWLTASQVNQLLQGRGPALLLGSYVLLQRLGEGGMGAVLRARHRNLRRLAAQAQIDQALTLERISNISIMQPAAYELTPARPRLSLAVAFGGAVLCSVAVALAVAYVAPAREAGQRPGPRRAAGGRRHGGGRERHELRRKSPRSPAEPGNAGRHRRVPTSDGTCATLACLAPAARQPSPT